MWWLLAADWTSAVPLNAHIETMPSAMVFKSRACGKCLGAESGALMNAISALIKQTQENALASLPHWRHGEKALSMKQKEVTHQTPNQPVCWSRTSASGMWEINLCCSKAMHLWYFCHSNPNILRHCYVC